MSRYIDVEPYEKEGWYLQKTYYDTYGAGVKTTPLKSVPTADVEPIKHGRWEVVYYDNIPTLAYCSRCDQMLRFTRETETVPNYCPNCGAKMDEVEE